VVLAGFYTRAGTLCPPTVSKQLEKGVSVTLARRAALDETRIKRITGLDFLQVPPRQRFPPAPTEQQL